MAGLLDNIQDYLKNRWEYINTPQPVEPMTKEEAMNFAMLGINKLNVPSNDILNIIKNIKKTGGSSVNLPTGISPTSGYMVAPSKTTEQMLPLSSLNKQAIEKYINQNATQLKSPDNYLGAWVNPENQQVYLDVSKNIPSQFLSKNMAKKADQEAIWDMLKMREIRTK